ncbi:MAG: outer membrane beta-barrel domain-containing protein [Myxococcales bacterium]|nr:outer membrane beta-barrel domain-containing protein [Myxococcales bacterium]MCB9531045.1 outer membrane beta-barrel domain-containing protein [Myxococcales bacterium]MCB9532955.1 outer membrane beta-barrel domain-containing protein [Myxococcales bacterium]
MKLTQWTVVLTLALAALSVPSAAKAQTAGADEQSPTLDGDLDTFWAEQRHVRVLQRRLYERDGEVQLTLFVGGIPNDPFLNYWPVGLRAAYHLSESIALEAGGSYVIGVDTELRKFLRDNDATVFLQDQQQWRANLALVWSPMYGKFSFLGTKLAHFDWFFGAGAGVLGVEHENGEGGTESQIKPEVVILTGWNLHLSQRFALRLDYHQGIYQAEIGGVAYPSELSIGGSVFF